MYVFVAGIQGGLVLAAREYAFIDWAHTLVRNGRNETEIF